MHVDLNPGFGRGMFQGMAKRVTINEGDRAISRAGDVGLIASEENFSKHREVI